MFVLSASLKCFTSFFYFLEEFTLSSRILLVPVILNTTVKLSVGDVESTDIWQIFYGLHESIDNLFLSRQPDCSFCVCLVGLEVCFKLKVTLQVLNVLK